uniref:F-box domain-containing protein n=1 Tax=Aegilops tauschii TaxID=37682 RepID=M8C0W9_AEGTA
MSSPAPHLVDEILEEILPPSAHPGRARPRLHRLPTPAALARASTACPRFRRIVTGRSFLRHYRKRHPPPLLGFVDESGFHPAQEPHPSAPLARALADAADFTYSFVPKPSMGRWRPRDARDGRVILQADSFCWNSNLAVCDPLSRRHLLLPPIPDELAAVGGKRPVEIVPILAPIGEEDDDETSFKSTIALATICISDVCLARQTKFLPEMEWQLENIIQLPGQYDYFTSGAAEGFLFLGATTEDQLDIDEDSLVWLLRTDWDVDYFSLDVKTSELVKG